MGGLVRTAGLQAAVDMWHGMVESSAEVVSVAGTTCDLPRDDNGNLKRPEGMSDREWHIHQDAMLPVKQAPIYMIEHYKRVELAQRVAGGPGAGELPQAIQYVVHVVSPKVYPVIDVTAEEK